MLIFSENRYTPTDINMMVIAGNGGYYYVHRSLYDQAVILHDIFKDNVSGLVDILVPGAQITESIHLFTTEVPAPINILGAFLVLIKEEISELKDMVGAIHVMSGPLNLRQMITVPIEMRTTIHFSLSITEEYQLAWDRFFTTAIPYGQMAYTKNDASTVYEEDNNDDESPGFDNPEAFDSAEDYLNSIDWDALIDSMEVSDEHETEKVTEAQEPAPVAEPEPEPEPVPTVPSSLSYLQNL